MDSNLEQNIHDQKPKPTEYLLITDYLKDYFEYRRSLDSAFYYEEWAAELGFKSRSFMRMLCQGTRKITQQFIKIFSEKYKFSELDTEYFTGMALYQRSESAIQKKFYLDKLFERYKPKGVESEIKDYIRFLSDEKLPLIQTILSFEDARINESVLSGLLNINKKEALDYLNRLEEMGLIKKALMESTGETIWVSNSKSFKVADSKSDAALKIFHKNSLVEAQAVLDCDNRQRRFRSVYFALKEESFSEATEEIEVFINKLKAKFGTTDLVNKKVFKMNLNIFDVTEKYEK